MSRTISSMQAKLRSIVTEWREDNSHPSNYIRETGMGEEVARVDRWCGGYQDTHKPVMIGWCARRGNRSMSGIVMVDYDNELTKSDAITSAINKAKVTASKALVELQER